MRSKSRAKDTTKFLIFSILSVILGQLGAQLVYLTVAASSCPHVDMISIISATPVDFDSYFVVVAMNDRYTFEINLDSLKVNGSNF